jgi:hypothetical protein
MIFVDLIHSVCLAYNQSSYFGTGRGSISVIYLV